MYMYIYIYLHMCVYTYIYIYIYIYICTLLCAFVILAILYPPSEIDLGLCWADFTDLEGIHLFHRMG